MLMRSLRGSFSQSANTWFGLALLVFFVGLSVQYSMKVAQPRDNGQKTRSAIVRWKTHLEAVAGDGATDAAYPNPPIMALLLSPLSRLDPLPMALTWFYLKVAMTLAALFAIFHLVAEANRPFPAWAKGLTVLLAIRPIIGDLQHGNVNLFILFLLVVTFFALQRGRGLLAGLTLGLAIACKLTPALFIPYLLWKRSWRALGGCLAGLVLFLWPGVVPALVLGAEENQQLLKQWYQCMVYPYAVENKVWSEHNNQSLVGVIFRLTTHSPSDSKFDENKQYVPTEWDNVLNLEPSQARWLVLSCEILFAGVVVYCCRTPPTQRTGWRINAEFAVVTLGMLLFSERTWKHHCVTLVLPFAVLCYHLARANLVRWLRGYLIGSLAVAALLMTAPSLGVVNDLGHWLTLHEGGSFAAAVVRLGISCEAFAKQSEVYGVYIVTYLILLVALTVTLRRAGSAERAATKTKSDENAVEPLAA